MSRDSRKARQRHKRQEKKRQMMRVTGSSPYRRAAQSGDIEACYITEDYVDKGVAAVVTLRRVAGGGHAMAAFLVDLWCIGLKDAWGRLSVSRSDFEEIIGHSSRNLSTLIRTDPAVARRLVAGAIRFSHENGFRLPPRYERWAALLGGISDWRTADISDFGRDGGLLYVGDVEELRKRLIGETVDRFLARPDVHYIIGGPASPMQTSPLNEDDVSEDDSDEVVPGGEEDLDLLDEMDPPHDDDLEGLLQAFRDQAIDSVRQWCFAHGEQPHPRMRDAWDIFMESILQCLDLRPGCEASEEELKQQREMMVHALSFESQVDREAIIEALIQLQRFTASFPNAEGWLTAMGMPPDLL